MEYLDEEYKVETIDDIPEINEINYNKNSIIAFAKLNRYFFIIFLCPIFCMLSNFLILLVNEKKLLKSQQFTLSIFLCLTYLIPGLFHFISYFKVNLNKIKHSSSYSNKNSELAIMNKYNKIKNKNFNLSKTMLMIFLLSIIIVIRALSFNFIYDKNVFEERLFYLFFIPLFSKIILKENIYKHQYFSLIIAFNGIIFLLIPVCLKLGLDDIVPNILNFISGILYSLFLVIIKFMIEKYYLSPLKVSLLFGILSLFINCIGYILYSLIVYNNFNYFKECFDFSQVDNILEINIYIIFISIFSIILQFLTLLALFYFSPTLIMVTDIISPILLWIAITIKKGELIMPDIVLYPIGYLIVLFSALIYNEIIILNFCGFNQNTKKFVNLRIDQEVEDIKNTQESLKSDNEGIL